MARSHTLSSLLLLLVALLATSVTAAKCAKGAHIIAVRGHPPAGSTPSGPENGYGITVPLLLALKKAVPGSTNESIPYPKNAKANEENMVAIKNIKAAVAKSVKNCPKTPIVLYGYSNGAFILTNAVCGSQNVFLTSTTPLAKKYAKNVIGTIMYSDGSYTPNAPWSKGPCTASSGIFARTNNDACTPYAKSMQSYCQKKDDYCCASGTDHSAHYTYFKTYDRQVGQFVKKAFKAFKKG